MSNETFPTFVGLDVAVQKTVYGDGDRVNIQVSAGGVELRSRRQRTTRYRYLLKITVRKSAPGAIDEANVLRSMYERHGGRWDAFNYTDNETGGSVRVRFDSDRLVFERIVAASHTGAWWVANEVALLTVKAAV